MVVVSVEFGDAASSVFGRVSCDTRLGHDVWGCDPVDVVVVSDDRDVIRRGLLAVTSIFSRFFWMVCEWV